MLVGSRNQLPTLDITYLSTPEELLEFSNSCLGSTVGERSLDWQYDGKEIWAELEEVLSEFVDELEIPLNFFQLTTSGKNRIEATLKAGDIFVRPMNNSLLSSPINQETRDRKVITSSSSVGYVDVNGIRYSCGYYRDDALPVLTRADHLYPLVAYSPAANCNAIVGQSWQVDLPFRRVFSIMESSMDTNIISVFNEALLSNESARRFAVINYNTVR